MTTTQAARDPLGEDAAKPAAPTVAAQAGESADRPSWGALLVVLAGTFITTLDFFIVNVAIPSIQRDLHAGTAAIQFIIAGYGIAFAAGLITAGRLGDLIGRRLMFVLGLALFTLASAASGLAQNSGELVAARIVQGLAAAMLTPQVLAILGTVYTGKYRAAAFNAYGLAMGLGGVFGQLIGGALIQANLFGLDWRLIFLINIPVGVVALALTPRLVPEFKGGRAGLDLVGAVLATAGLVAIVLPLIEGREQGWPEWTWVSLIASVPLLGGFLAYQRRLSARNGSPLVDLSLFRERTYSVGLIIFQIYTLVMGSFFLVLALYLQQGHGLSALRSGMIIIPLGLGFFVSSAMAAQLTAKLGRQVLAVGALEVAIGYGILAETVSSIGVTGNIEWLIPGLLISGFGMGMVMAPLPNIAMARVDQEHAAAASGVLSTVQEVGGALGIALVGIVFFNAVNGSSTEHYARAFELSMILLIAFAVIVVGVVQTLPKASKQR